MFGAGLKWDETLAMPLGDSLSILESHLDRLAIERHRHSELVWASIAPHSSRPIPAPEPPELDQ
jgi:hypothetical protein